jgi:hypothetical protein
MADPKAQILPVGTKVKIEGLDEPMEVKAHKEDNGKLYYLCVSGVEAVLLERHEFEVA